jgi:8-oxo-dGTP pyrophosphatase MutT (NUDIX family)
MPTLTQRRPLAPPGQRRAAALCLRRKHGQVQLLVVSTRSGRVTLPKGRIEVGEDPAATALREAGEEAGVRGVVTEHVGSWRHGASRQHVEGYLVSVRARGRPQRSERWRNVRWVDVDTAAEQLARRCPRRTDRDALRTVLAAATALVAR